jgi:hypothetical protein
MVGGTVGTGGGTVGTGGGGVRFGTVECSNLHNRNLR